MRLALPLLLFLALPGYASDPFEVGWKGATATTASGAGIQLHGLMMGRWQLRHDSIQTQAGLNVPHARTQLVVHGPDKQLAVTLHSEWANAARLLDARVDVRPDAHWHLAFGQMIVPVQRSWLIPRFEVLLPERTPTSGTFAPGRRVGATGAYATEGGTLQATVGVFEPGLGTPPLSFPRAPLAMARVQLNPLGAPAATELPSLREDAQPTFSIGASAFVEPVAYDTDPPIEATWLTSAADVTLHLDGFTFTTEGSLRLTEEGIGGWGTTTQVGQFVVPKRLSLISRFSTIDQQLDAVETTIEGGFAWFAVESHLMGHVRYGYLTGNSAPAHLVTVQTHLMF